MQSNDFSSRLGTKSTRTGVPLGLLRLRFLQKTIKHRRRIWYQWKSSALQVALHGNNWRRLHIVRWYVFRLVLLCMLQQQNRNLKCTMLEILDNGDSESHTKKKTKRMRTTFTEEQVQILQANFQIDSNPDGQDLERIAQITGLSKRVTQVNGKKSLAKCKFLGERRGFSAGWGMPSCAMPRRSYSQGWSGTRGIWGTWSKAAAPMIWPSPLGVRPRSLDHFCARAMNIEYGPHRFELLSRPYTESSS